jgi:small subunit ribosomal protein S6e
MPLKLNISEKGKAWKLEVEPDVLAGKSIGEKFNGKIVKPELDGYELEITGGSDSSGFPMSKSIEGIGLKGVLLKQGWGMHTKPKGLKKKKQKLSKGLRLRKTVRGRAISEKSVQVNMKVLKEGKKPLAEIFPDQNKPKTASAPAEKPAESSEETEK